MGPWRYGLTLLPGASNPDDERDEGKVDDAAIGPRLALKDLTAARTAGDAFGSPMPVARTLIDLYQQLIAAGQSELGCQAIYPLLGPKAGRTTER